MSKKLEEKQRRRLAEERRRAEERKAHRRRNLITLGIALLVGVGVVLLIMNERNAEETVSSEPIGVSAADAGCGDVEVVDDKLSQEHVDAGTQVDYDQSPPVGGPHWPPGFQADAGFYPDTVEEESLVHNLEHGQIVIWYRPEIDDTTRDDLEEYVDRENDKSLEEIPTAVAPLIAAPYDDIDSQYAYVITAWGASQSCARMSSDAIDDFRAEYQGQGPEKITPPFNP